MPKKDKPPKENVPGAERRAVIIIHSEVTDTGEVRPTNVPVQGPAPGKIITILQEAGDVGPNGERTAKAVSATPRDTLLLILQTSLDNPKLKGEQRAEFARVFETLLDLLETLEITKTGENIETKFTVFDNNRKIEAMTAMQSVYAQLAVIQLAQPNGPTWPVQLTKADLTPGAEKPGTLPTIIGEPTFTRHPRTASRFMAQRVGRDKGAKDIMKVPANEIPTLFSDFQQGHREALPKLASAILGICWQYWDTLPKGPGNTIKFEKVHLREIAEKTGGLTLDQVKRLFILLGRYAYEFDDPINAGKGSTVIFTPFTVRFNYPGEVEKQAAIAMGSRRASKMDLIPGHAIDSIEITPNDIFLRDLHATKQGQSLGYFLASENYPTFPLSLSDMAVKLFHYTVSHPKNSKVKEATFWRGLNLESDIKKRGKGVIEAKVNEAAKELIEAGHLHSFNKTGAYWQWETLEKVIKYQEPRKSAKANGDEKPKRRGRPPKQK